MKLDYEFFHRDAVEVAKDLVGKIVVCKNSAGEIKKLRITETEAYCGEEDTACHAHKGRTKRTEVLYMKAGTVYVYLCYGMHWLLNIVTGEENQPQAVLIRACEGNANGPGKLTKALGINKDFNRLSVCTDDAIHIEDDGYKCRIAKDKRVGIAYASIKDQNRLWRFIDKNTLESCNKREAVK